VAGPDLSHREDVLDALHGELQASGAVGCNRVPRGGGIVPYGKADPPKELGERRLVFQNTVPDMYARRPRFCGREREREPAGSGTAPG
jgi:hypothetical protein